MPFYGSRRPLFKKRERLYIRWWEFCFFSPQHYDIIITLITHKRCKKLWLFNNTSPERKSEFGMRYMMFYIVVTIFQGKTRRKKNYYRHPDILSVLMPSLLYIFLMRFLPKRRENPWSFFFTTELSQRRCNIPPHQRWKQQRWPERNPPLFFWWGVHGMPVNWHLAVNTKRGYI